MQVTVLGFVTHVANTMEKGNTKQQKKIPSTEFPPLVRRFNLANSIIDFLILKSHTFTQGEFQTKAFSVGVGDQSSSLWFTVKVLSQLEWQKSYTFCLHFVSGHVGERDSEVYSA